MQLRRIEIHGFKTFANPTTIEFPRGITAVVGPNGSGKSNVFDAILWVLGEGNVRALRGGKLQDVIFAGSANRRPLGMADVALTFDNQAGKLPLPFGEVTVTRRVYRSGESEYLINRTACRLRDIVDLFLDTGIGRESYFALNQGEIDRVLSVDPQERRALFEEAAGVKRYQVRRRESLRKLEVCEANLLRLNDLIGEVESRVGPLERQAGAATRYLEISAEARELELSVFAAEWTRLSAHQNSVQRELGRAREELAAVQAEAAAAAAREELLRAHFHRADEAVDHAQQEHDRLVEERSSLEAQIGVLEERLRSLTATGERDRISVENLSAQCSEILESARAGESELRDLTRDLQKTETKAIELRSTLAQHDVLLKNALAAIEAAQSRQVELAARQARNEAERQAAELRLRSLSERREDLSVEARKKQEQLTALSSRLEDLRTSGENLSQSERETADQIAAGRLRIEELQTELSRQDQTLREEERRTVEARSRLKWLQDLQGQREGYYRGARSVLKAAGTPALPGHFAAVADILQFDRCYEAALEAALGGSAQDIVCRTDSEARLAIEFLKRTGDGRATFLSMELVSQLARPDGAPQGSAGGMIGTAADLVTCDAEYLPIVQMLLGRVVVCDTLENANRAARRLQRWSRLVTLDGEVVSSHGAMTGGSRKKEQSGLLGRAGEIQQTQETLSELGGRLHGIEQHRLDLSTRLDTARNALRDLELSLSSCRSRASLIRQDQQRLVEESRRIQKEADASQQEIVRNLRLEEETREALQRLILSPDPVGSPGNGPDGANAATGEGGEALIERLRADAARRAEARDRTREELNVVTVESAALRERQKAAGRRTEDLRRRQDRMRSEENEARSRLQQIKASSTSIEREIEALRQARRPQTEIERQLSQVVELRQQRSAVRAEVEQLTGSLRALNQQEQASTLRKVRAETTLAAVQREVLAIRVALAEDFGLKSREGKSRDSRPDTPSDQESPAGEAAAKPDSELHESAVHSDELEEDGSEGDRALPDDATITGFLAGVAPATHPEHTRLAAGKLRRQMRALEPVNLSAIEESREIQDRLRFLSQQRSDVESAEKDLKTLIQQIDREVQERFLIAFQAIAIQFDELFKKLFGGGQTRLTLTDPEDPTQGGVEISAQPPGKRLQSLQLLSGGERALTAVALLFAMLRVRPVPFCIMDEVDAALDEGNIARFGEVLQEFARQTQFVIVTHNRGTMEIADRLYGVTMAEPGVSSTLSVRLGDIEPQAA